MAIGKTTLAEVQDQVQKFWSPMLTKELRESLLLGSLVNREYEGSIQEQGDTVRVSQIVSPNGELRTVGVDADSFETEQLATMKVDIKADKRAVAAFEFTQLSQLQSQIGSQESEIRDALRFAIERQINNHLYSVAVAPSEHTMYGVTDMNSSKLLLARKAAGKAKWLRNKGWFALLDSSYYTDLLASGTMTSGDMVDDRPVVGGQISTPRYGFNILEDNSRAEDAGLIFHPDFMHLVMQSEISFKISDQHANKKFGFIISADIIFGAKLGIEGGKKCIAVTSAAAPTGVTGLV